MKARHGTWWSLAVAASSLAGCPGQLDEQVFDTGVHSGACTNDDVQRMVFNASCTSSGCHDSSNQPGGGLDLLSPGAQQRLVSVPVPAGQTCSHAGLPLIAPGDPAHSLLLLKVEPSPPCGSRMPLGAVSGLADNQIECVRSWIASLPPATTPFDGGVIPDVGMPETSAHDMGVPEVTPTDTAPTDGTMATDAGADLVVPMDTGAPDAGVDATPTLDAGTDTGSTVDDGVDAGTDVAIDIGVSA